MRAVLFDAGNTLLQLDYVWLSGVVASHGGSATPEEIAGAAARIVRENSRLYGTVPPATEAGSVFMGSFSAMGRAAGLGEEAALAFARAAYAEDSLDPRGLWRCPAPDAAQVLSRLQHRGLLLGVVSNADGKAEAHLELAGLGGYLSAVIDSARVGVQKPDPRIFKIAVERLSTVPEECLYVGDILEVDVWGAQAAGLRALLYDRWNVYPEISHGRIRSLTEVSSAVGTSQVSGEASG